MNTPGSPNCTAPRTRNSAANSVLPQPAPPHTSVGRPRGNPPSVISSRPWMPVGHLGKRVVGAVGLEVFFFIPEHSWVNGGKTKLRLGRKQISHPTPALGVFATPSHIAVTT